MAPRSNSRQVSVRLSVEDAELFERRLKRAGKTGQTSLEQIGKAAVPASRGLQRVDAISRGLQGTLRTVEGPLGGVAGRVTALGSTLRAVPAPALAVGAAITGVGIAVAAAFDRVGPALDRATQLADLSDRLGVGVEALQEWRFAAEQASVSQQTFDLALQRFTRRTAQAAQGTGEAKGTLEQLNVSLTDSQGRLKSTDRLLLEVADAMAGLSNQSERVAAAQKLFDSEGVAFLNVLQQGSTAIQEQREQARRLGVVMDESMIQRARETNNELAAMQRIIDTQLDTAVIELGPLLVSLAGAFADVATSVSDVVASFQELERQPSRFIEREIEDLTAQREKLLKDFERLSDPSAAGGRVSPALRASGAENAFIEATALQRRIEERQAELARRVSARSDPPPALPPLPSSDSDKDGPDPIPDQTRTQAAIAGLRQQVELQRLSKVERAAETEVRRIQQVAIAEGTLLTQQELELVRGLVTERERLKVAEKDAAEAAANKKKLDTEGLRIAESLRTAQEVYNAELLRLGELQRAGAIDQETYSRALQAAEQDLQAATFGVDDLATALDRGLNSAINGQIDSWEDLGRVAIQVLTDVTTALAKTEGAFNRSGGVFDQIFSALSLDKIGLSSSFGSGSSGSGQGPQFSGTGSEGLQSSGSFATGGSFFVGGPGGTDSQRVQFNATPGERVDILTPAQQAAQVPQLARRGGGRPFVVQIIDQRRAGSPPIEAQPFVGPDGVEGVRAVVRDELTQRQGDLNEAAFNHTMLRLEEFPGARR